MVERLSQSGKELQTTKQVHSLKEALPSYHAAIQKLLGDPAIRRSQVPERLLEEYDRIRKTPTSRTSQTSSRSASQRPAGEAPSTR